MDLYAQNILDRYKSPLYKDKVIESSISRKEANHSCGDVVEVFARIQDDIMTSYSFSGVGCAISMAAADILGDLTHEMNVEEVLAISKEEIFEMLGIEISLRRSKCALLAPLALQNALLEYKNRPSRRWTYYHLDKE